MIIIRYLVQTTLKSQIAITFILILIFCSQKIINILSALVQENIPSKLIFPLLALGIPNMAQLILPLSLFLGLLMTYSKFYINNEITIMHACGLGKKVLVIAALILAFITAIIAVINVTWMLPWSAKYQEQVLMDVKNNPSLARITEGQFKTTKNQNIVLYISKAKGKKFTDIFIAQLRSDNHQRPYVIIAESGCIREDQNKNQIMVLNKGTRYEGTALSRDFRITDFKNYEIVINHNETAVTDNKIKQKNMLQLWHATDTESKAELHWRLTLVIAVMIMALTAVPLSEVNHRQGRLLSMLPAILIYLIFFLLQSTLHSHAVKGEINSKIAMWLVNMFFLLLAIILNIWDNLLIHRLYTKFHK